MDAPETTTTPTDTGMELPDTPDEEDLQKMSKEQVIALYRRAQQGRDNQKQKLRGCKQKLREHKQKLHECRLELLDSEHVLNQSDKIIVSLLELVGDFNDGTAETTGAAGVTGYMRSPELSDGTTGAWFQCAREQFGKVIQQPNTISNNVSSSTLTHRDISRTSEDQKHFCSPKPPSTTLTPTCPASPDT
jgi:hypothetical protein